MYSCFIYSKILLVASVWLMTSLKSCNGNMTVNTMNELCFVKKLEAVFAYSIL